MAYTTRVRLEDFFDRELDCAPLWASGASVGPVRAGGDASQESFGGSAKAAARRFPSCGGVYLLTDERDRVVQLAGAGDLRRALGERLLGPGGAGGREFRPGGRRRLELGRIVRKARWRTAHSMFEITYEYYRIARVLMPDDYLEQVAFGPSWFVHVDPSAAVPRFAVSKTLGSAGGVDLGPLATHADAAQLVQIIEDAFDLCRYFDVLAQAPNGQACAYFDMGKCPAPCDGSIPMSQYRRMVSSALAFACGEREDVYDQWKRQMQESAEELSYERAAMFKQRLERARGIERASFRFTRPLQEFNYLIVQRGGGRTRVKPFFVRGGRIAAGETARLKDVDKTAAKWIDQMDRSAEAVPVGHPTPAQDRQEVTEQVWLVSHFLFKRDAPGLFLHRSALDEPAKLAERIRSRFAVKPRQPDTDPRRAAC